MLVVRNYFLRNFIFGSKNNIFLYKGKKFCLVLVRVIFFILFFVVKKYFDSFEEAEKCF